MIDIKKYTAFLVKTGLNPAEFLFLYYLYLVNYVDVKYKKEMRDYTELFGVMEKEIKKTYPEEGKQHLVGRGFLKIVNKGATIKDYIVLSPFTEAFIDVWQAGTEMYDAYPDRAMIKGVSIPIKTMDRDEARQSYAEKIMYSLEEHKEVLLDIKWAAEQQLINMSMAKFLGSEQWKDWRKARTCETTKSSTPKFFDNDY